MPERAEVVVVGGGVMGVATAYWLARFGRDVVLLEARRLGSGASTRSAGLVLGRSSGLEDLSILRTLVADEEIDAQYQEPGHLALASSERVLERIREEIRRRPPSASPLCLLDHDGCEELLGMRINAGYLGGRWLPYAGVVHPARLLYGLARAAIRRGALIAQQAPVTRLTVNPNGDGAIVDTPSARIRARRVVLACGIGTRRLWRGLRNVLTAARGQMLATAPMRPLFRVGLAVDWGTAYWRQADDGAVILGGCRGPDDVSEASARPMLNEAIQSRLTSFLPRTFPDFPPVTVARRWAGIMDETPDGRPLAGACTPAGDLWLLAGFGGHGLPPALGVAHALVQEMIYEQRVPELEPFDPLRFPEVAR